MWDPIPREARGTGQGDDPHPSQPHPLQLYPHDRNTSFDDNAAHLAKLGQLAVDGRGKHAAATTRRWDPL